jgi:predicted dehydrogenase
MLRFGLFGAGRIGRVHAASLATHPRTELAVVHDPIEAAASAVAALYGAVPTQDAEAILGDPGSGGELCQITNSRRCSLGYDQRVEAFGAEGMLSAGNQTATSVRRSGAAGTEAAAPYLNFFLDRHADAYRAELDHLVSCVEQGTAPSPGFADGRAALVLADAANESLRTGRAVRVHS